MYFSAAWVYLLTLPVQLQQKWTTSAPYAAHFCTIRNEALLAKLRARCKQHPDKHTADEVGDLFRTMPPLQQARATESLSESVCV